MESDDEIAEAEVDDEESLRNKMELLPLEDRISVREQYRELFTTAQSAAAEGNLDLNDIEAGIEQTNRIFESEKVLFPTEGTRDAETLKQYSELLHFKVSAQKDDGLQFNSNLYADKLVTQMKVMAPCDDEEENDFPTATQWSEFGKAVGGYLKRAPGLHYLYGSFADGENEGATQANLTQAQQPQPPQRRAKPKDVLAALTQPRAVANASDVNESEQTTKLVDLVWKRMKVVYEQKGRSPISYFEFVLDPESFTQTVENMFYVSFLIKDGKVGMELDNTGLPVLTLHEEVGEGGRQNGRGPCNQCIITIDMKTWRELLETFNVKTAALTFK